MRLMNAKLRHASDGECHIEVAWADWFSQHSDALHGGLIASLADTAATYAVMSMQPPGEIAITVEFKINFLSPARGQKIGATGRALRMGKRLAVASATLSCDDRPDCAEFLGTFTRLQSEILNQEQNS